MKDFKVKKAPKLEKLSDFPMGSSCESFNITEINAGWRVFKPVLDVDKCVNCYRCYLVCPEGAIHKNNDKFEIDEDFCKGCGLCAHECKVNAISMIKETK